jgi:hypothetical protein
LKQNHVLVLKACENDSQRNFQTRSSCIERLMTSLLTAPEISDVVFFLWWDITNFGWPEERESLMAETASFTVTVHFGTPNLKNIIRYTLL